MKLTIAVLLAMVALVAARPGNVLNLDLDDLHHDFSIDSLEEDNVITGMYSWTSPEGEEFFVRYIADDDGYRVIESNAVPATADGVEANGRQAFFSSEERSFETSFEDRK